MFYIILWAKNHFLFAHLREEMSGKALSIQREEVRQQMKFESIWLSVCDFHNIDFLLFYYDLDTFLLYYVSTIYSHVIKNIYRVLCRQMFFLSQIAP